MGTCMIIWPQAFCRSRVEETPLYSFQAIFPDTMARRILGGLHVKELALFLSEIARIGLQPTSRSSWEMSESVDIEEWTDMHALR